MTTAQDMVSYALEKIGAYAAGETLTAADLSRAMTVLNAMIDSWSNEALTTFAIKEQSLPLVVNQLTYELGPGGDLEDRPIRLIYGPGAAYLTDVNGNRYPVAVYPQDKWNELWNLTQINATIPSVIFYDPQYPVGILKVYPLYAGGLGMTLYFDSYLKLSSFALPTTTVSLPPGYEKAIQDNLAIELWPFFKPDGSMPGELLFRQAAESKANVKRSNTRENMADFEKVLLSRAQPQYNVYSDSYR